MDLDELKHAWQEMDRRLEVNEERVDRAMREVKLGRTRSALRRHGAVLIFEVVCGVLAVALVVSFLREQYSVARFALPAAVLAIAAVASLAANVAQLAGTFSVDYAAPVIAIQRQLAGLRAARIQIVQWTLLLSPLLWTPLAIVAAKWLWELDIYATVGPMVVALNLVIGLAVIPLGILGARACANSLGHSPALKRFADSVAGNSLMRALESVHELERFEQE